MMIFEQITKKPFGISNMMDEYIYFYSLLLANNPDFNMSFGDFLDELDNQPSLILEFKKAMEDYSNKFKLTNEDNIGDSDDKKKV